MTRVIMLTVVLWAAGCGGKEESTGGGGGTDTGSAKSGSGSTAKTGSAANTGSGSGSGSASDVAKKAPDVPTEVDFEEDASKRITEKSLASEVEKLEKELNDTGAKTP